MATAFPAPRNPLGKRRRATTDTGPASPDDIAAAESADGPVAEGIRHPVGAMAVAVTGP